MDYTKALNAYREREMAVLEGLDLNSISCVMNILEDARLQGKKIFICGNGGSAATASHYCCDFNKGVSENQNVKYNFECLNDNIPTLMAVANDIGYEEVFRFPLKNKMKSGDILDQVILRMLSMRLSMRKASVVQRLLLLDTLAEK